eukprot:scaffold13044_cov26-Tisochrysis_lutea.AAC.1
MHAHTHRQLRTSHKAHSRSAQYSTPVFATFLKERSSGLNRLEPSAAPRVKALRYSGRPAS